MQHITFDKHTPAHYRQLANASYQLITALKREHPHIVQHLTKKGAH